MAERPILFSGPMVRAILDGKKTQTRRVVKPTMTAPRIAPLRMEPWIDEFSGAQETDDRGLPCWLGFHPDYPGDAKWFSCPYGREGDRLWVRETWACDEYGRRHQSQGMVYYRADAESMGAWRPSIHMPRWASRITLEITAVRVEPLQNIGEMDAMHEGCKLPTNSPRNYRRAFRALWNDINEKHGYGWDSNPWVWVVSFRRVQP